MVVALPRAECFKRSGKVEGAVAAQPKFAILLGLEASLPGNDELTENSIIALNRAVENWCEALEVILRRWRVANFGNRTFSRREQGQQHHNSQSCF